LPPRVIAGAAFYIDVIFESNQPSFAFTIELLLGYGIFCLAFVFDPGRVVFWFIGVVIEDAEAE